MIDMDSCYRYKQELHKRCIIRLFVKTVGPTFLKELYLMYTMCMAKRWTGRQTGIATL